MAVSTRVHQREFRSELRALYDDYRKALFDVLCYQTHLARLRLLRRILDGTLVASSSGALAAWWLWHSAAGQRVWIGLAAATAATAVLRVALPMARNAEKYKSLKEAHEMLFDDLGEVVERVRVRQSLDLESVKLWSAAFKRMERGASADLRRPYLSRRLRLRCEEEVNRRIPIRGFYMPQPSMSAGDSRADASPGADRSLSKGGAPERYSCGPCLPDAR